MNNTLEAHLNEALASSHALPLGVGTEVRDFLRAARRAAGIEAPVKKKQTSLETNVRNHEMSIGNLKERMDRVSTRLAKMEERSRRIYKAF